MYREPHRGLYRDNPHRRCLGTVCDNCGFEFDPEDQMGCSILSCPNCKKVFM